MTPMQHIPFGLLLLLFITGSPKISLDGGTTCASFILVANALPMDESPEIVIHEEEPTMETIPIKNQANTNNSSVLKQSPYHEGLVTLVAFLSMILLFLVITMALPMSLQNWVFWPCMKDNDQFNYIDVGLYKTRHSMYRKEVYSKEMRKKRGSWLRRKWLHGKKSSSTSIGVTEAIQNATDLSLVHNQMRNPPGRRCNSVFVNKSARLIVDSLDDETGMSDEKRPRSLSTPGRKTSSATPRVTFVPEIIGDELSINDEHILDDVMLHSVEFDNEAEVEGYGDPMTSSLCSIPEEPSLATIGQPSSGSSQILTSGVNSQQVSFTSQHIPSYAENDGRYFYPQGDSFICSGESDTSELNTSEKYKGLTPSKSDSYLTRERSEDMKDILL